MIKNNKKIIYFFKRVNFFGVGQILMLVFFIGIIITTSLVGRHYYLKFHHSNQYAIDASLLTVDSLITGATITLIAFTNFSPISSGSASLFRRIYWRTTKLTNKALWYEKFIWFFSGAFIRPHFSITISTTSTLVTILSFESVQHNNIYFIYQSFLLIVITFWMFFGTLVRYYLFNKYALRTTAKYLENFFTLKIKPTNKPIFIKKFMGYVNLLRITKNFELIQEIFYRFIKDEKIYQDLEFNEYTINNDDGISWNNGDYQGYLARMIKPSSKDINSMDAYQLLIWNVFKNICSFDAENEAWKKKWLINEVKERFGDECRNKKCKENCGNKEIKDNLKKWIIKIENLITNKEPVKEDVSKILLGAKKFEEILKDAQAEKENIDKNKNKKAKYLKRHGDKKQLKNNENLKQKKFKAKQSKKESKFKAKQSKKESKFQEKENKKENKSKKMHKWKSIFKK